MALGLLWYSRLPVDSDALAGSDRRPGDPHPADLDVLIDVLPYALLFGLGISCVVAPLTSTLMGSISGRFSGLGSAINNSISRVGQPLLGALVFIAVSAAYYASLGTQAGLDTTDPAVRTAFQPLNPPAAARRSAGRRREPGVDRRIPPGDADLRRVARDRRGVSWFGLREGAGGPATAVRARRASRLTTADAARLGRPDLRPGRRPDDPLGVARSSTASRSTATSGSSMPAAAAGASRSCWPGACRAAGWSRSTARRR